MLWASREKCQPQGDRGFNHYQMLKGRVLRDLMSTLGGRGGGAHSVYREGFQELETQTYAGLSELKFNRGSEKKGKVL